MNEGAEKEYEILFTIGDMLLLHMEGMRKEDGRWPEHLSGIYGAIMDVVRELKDQF